MLGMGDWKTIRFFLLQAIFQFDNYSIHGNKLHLIKIKVILSEGTLLF